MKLKLVPENTCVLQVTGVAATLLTLKLPTVSSNCSVELTVLPVTLIILPTILIPIAVYFILGFITKIKESNRIIHWSLLVSFIAFGLFLLKQYLFYLTFGLVFKKGIVYTSYIFPNFLFPSLRNLLLKFDFFVNSSFFGIIIDTIFIFIIYFIIGAIIGLIVSKIRKK